MKPVWPVGLFVLWTTCVGAGPPRFDFEGTWASRGYGRVLEIGAGDVRVYDVTARDCVLHERRTLDLFLHGIDRINRSDENLFSYYFEGGVTRYEYRRLAELPATCAATPDGATDDDPVRNFEFFWRSFDENYAFFDVRGVDWQAVYREYRPRISPVTTPDELYGTLTEIIERIDDRHVLVERAGHPRHYSGHPGTLAKLLARTRPGGGPVAREDFLPAAKRIVAEHYLKDSLREAVNGQFTWGWAAEGIGYVSIDSMEDYVPDGATLRDSHRQVLEVMNRVIGDLQDARGIIVDARWNGGGYDSNALHIAGHFTDRQRLAFTKRARFGDSHTPEQEIFIPWHPRKVFAGPVVYLCGRDTLSAAEILSLAMMAIPNVTSMGEPTVGSLSDTHSVYLPNRWRVQISNEPYKAIDGIVYEAAGIPVDIELAPADDATFESWVRSVMDAAIARLSGMPLEPDSAMAGSHAVDPAATQNSAPTARILATRN